MKLIRSFLKLLGPGLITGASDDDPSGVATYAQTGAQFGYTPLWTTFYTIPFMTVIQEMCGRIGLVTGKGLGGVIRQHYPKIILYASIFILFVANIINVGADLGAMAETVKLLLPGPFLFWIVIITSISLGLEIFIPYPTYARYLKFVVLTLFVYGVTVFVIKQDWAKIAFSTFIPTLKFDSSFVLNLVALLGTTISPYLFFWQSDEEVEERIEKHRQKDIGVKVGYTTKKDLRNLRIDTIIGMVFSNLISFFIIITAASTLHTHGIKNIESASQAAQSLKPVAGDLASFLFAAGIIGGGLLAVPILAGSAAYALSEALKIKAGLNKNYRRAPIFYGIIILATVLGVLVNVTPIKPFQLLYYTAALNGLAAPILMFLILAISNNKKIMGEHTNPPLSNILGGFIAIVMGIGGILLLFSLLKS